MRALALVAFALVAASPAAAQPPLANVTPQAIDFGAVRIGQPVTVPVTIKNLAHTTMTLAGGGIANNASFSALTSTCGNVIAPDATCTINYTFRPADNTGTRLTAATTLQAIAGTRSQSFRISLQGSGFGSLLTISPTTIDFGDQLVGQAVTVPVTVYNPLAVPVSLAGGNPGDPAFPVLSSCDQPNPPGAIAAFGTCRLNVSFVPPAIGSFAASASLWAATPAPFATHDTPITLTGNGVATLPLARTVPVGIGFGIVKVGAKASVPMLSTNLTTTPIQTGGGGFTEVASDGGAFKALHLGGTGCDGGTGTMSGGSTCAARYDFRPREAREHAGFTSRAFWRTGVWQPVDIAVTGFGVGKLGRLGPVGFDFGGVAVGTRATVAVRVENDGEYDISGFTGGAVTTAGFSMTTTCTGAIAPGQACEYRYQFSSSFGSIAARSATTRISFQDEAGIGATYEIVMRATATSQVP